MSCIQGLKGGPKHAKLQFSKLTHSRNGEKPLFKVPPIPRSKCVKGYSNMTINKMKSLLSSTEHATPYFVSQILQQGEFAALIDSIENSLVGPELILERCNLGMEKLFQVCRALRRNKDVKSLVLCFNDLWDSSLVSLAEALKYNHSLEQIDLSHNAISSHGIGILAQGLAYNTSVKTLLLRDNNIDDEGAFELKRLLDVNYTIAHIEIHFNNVRHSLSLSIEKALFERKYYDSIPYGKSFNHFLEEGKKENSDDEDDSESQISQNETYILEDGRSISSACSSPESGRKNPESLDMTLFWQVLGQVKRLVTFCDIEVCIMDTKTIWRKFVDAVAKNVDILKDDPEKVLKAEIEIPLKEYQYEINFRRVTLGNIVALTNGSADWVNLLVPLGEKYSSNDKAEILKLLEVSIYWEKIEEGEVAMVKNGKGERTEDNAPNDPLEEPTSAKPEGDLNISFEWEVKESATFEKPSYTDMLKVGMRQNNKLFSEIARIPAKRSRERENGVTKRKVANGPNSAASLKMLRAIETEQERSPAGPSLGKLNSFDNKEPEEPDFSLTGRCNDPGVSVSLGESSQPNNAVVDHRMDVSEDPLSEADSHENTTPPKMNLRDNIAVKEDDVNTTSDFDESDLTKKENTVDSSYPDIENVNKLPSLVTEDDFVHIEDIKCNYETCSNCSTVTLEECHLEERENTHENNAEEADLVNCFDIVDYDTEKEGDIGDASPKLRTMSCGLPDSPMECSPNFNSPEQELDDSNSSIDEFVLV
eukprot:Nk52_evm47s226 gene=Nk52_evmTU47s226